MGPISASIVVDQPRERVFDFLCDLANRESFSDHFISELRLERLPSSGVGAAARFRHRIYERGRGGRIDRIPVFTVWELVGEPGGATELRLTFWTEPSHPVDRARELFGATRWYRRQWRRALRRLKGLLESGASVEPVRVAGEDRIPAAPR